MNKEEKILKFIKSRYKKKISLDTKIFQVLNIDSFEFVKLVAQVQIIVKKNIFLIFQKIFRILV